ncbi:hypothetical protein HYDPIDRAFT_97473 [Hydnomerulius pinastri MD-312]|uniref:Protein kinase domain-containing protein n=1 Tax=Hydnomerulius pinastri MD-312 TaxID=994086 RepID=A0A0C9W3Y9_9AGAM|nr:hypothetical protein HYDPIDRAFT_97473 [Hydnomerulius pinastri MD-312]
MNIKSSTSSKVVLDCHALVWQEGSYFAMVLENLGPFLCDLLQFSSNGTFNLHHVAELGLQMISCLEYTHSCNFIHHNIKPQNILMGLGESKNTAFLINFDIAREYHDALLCIHIPM